MTASRKAFVEAMQAVDGVVLGKKLQVRLAFTALLAGGHLLIEDFPGVGKTILVQALAKVCGLTFQRLQFTSDLLPADIVGAVVFERQKELFTFRPGPLFAQLILADEVNRATPRTQSALLEALEEHRVTVDGQTYDLPEPFFVIATQNPAYQIGTYPLPESQLDRFLMRLELGYPEAEAERELLAGGDRRQLLDDLKPCLNNSDLLQCQRQAAALHVADPLLDYLQELLKRSRDGGLFQRGLSPRAGLALLAAARAWAWLDGVAFVRPEDLQAVFFVVAGHRLETVDGSDSAPLIKQLLDSVPLS
ncbi:MAG: AAA family ATPase [Deltaproteobacteria bacterium]|nr:AAA family ATPase [Deltaproteobacteria bacterium]